MIIVSNQYYSANFSCLEEVLAFFGEDTYNSLLSNEHSEMTLSFI